MRDLRELEINAFLAQAELLAQLQALPAWDAWVILLRDMRQAALEELARCSDAGDFRYWQGVAGGLGEILDRPARIVSEADAYRTAEEADKRALRPELRAIVGAGLDHEGDV